MHKCQLLLYNFGISGSEGAHSQSIIPLQARVDVTKIWKRIELNREERKVIMQLLPNYFLLRNQTLVDNIMYSYSALVKLLRKIGHLQVLCSASFAFFSENEGGFGIALALYILHNWFIWTVCQYGMYKSECGLNRKYSWNLSKHLLIINNLYLTAWYFIC